MNGSELESTLYAWVDRFRSLSSAPAWQRLAMELSKNDLLTMVFLQRAEQARMSELAAYLGVPLNTATGVVARLQGRGLVEREPSPGDRRVVIVSLSDQGRDQVASGLREALGFAARVLDGLSPEQLELLLHTADRVLGLLLEPELTTPQPKRRRIPID